MVLRGYNLHGIHCEECKPELNDPSITIELDPHDPCESNTFLLAKKVWGVYTIMWSMIQGKKIIRKESETYPSLKCHFINFCVAPRNT